MSQPTAVLPSFATLRAPVGEGTALPGVVALARRSCQPLLRALYAWAEASVEEGPASAWEHSWLVAVEPRVGQMLAPFLFELVYDTSTATWRMCQAYSTELQELPATSLTATLTLLGELVPGSQATHYWPQPH